MHSYCSCLYVWPNTDDARIIAYSIIQWQLSAVPIQKCQWAIKCVMSCSYRRIHLLHRLLYTVYHIYVVCIINGESDTVQYNATLLSSSYEMQLKRSMRKHTHTNTQEMANC